MSQRCLVSFPGIVTEGDNVSLKFWTVPTIDQSDWSMCILERPRKVGGVKYIWSTSIHDKASKEPGRVVERHQPQFKNGPNAQS